MPKAPEETRNTYGITYLTKDAPLTDAQVKHLAGGGTWDTMPKAEAKVEAPKKKEEPKKETKKKVPQLQRTKPVVHKNPNKKGISDEEFQRIHDAYTKEQDAKKPSAEKPDARGAKYSTPDKKELTADQYHRLYHGQAGKPIESHTKEPNKPFTPSKPQTKQQQAKEDKARKTTEAFTQTARPQKSPVGSSTVHNTHTLTSQEGETSGQYHPVVTEKPIQIEGTSQLKQYPKDSKANKKQPISRIGGARAGAGRKAKNPILTPAEVAAMAAQQKKKSIENNYIIMGYDTITAKLKAINDTLKGGGWRKDRPAERSAPKTETTATGEKITTTEQPESNQFASSGETPKEHRENRQGREVGDNWMKFFHEMMGKKPDTIEPRQDKIQVDRDHTIKNPEKAKEPKKKDPFDINNR